MKQTRRDGVEGESVCVSVCACERERDRVCVSVLCLRRKVSLGFSFRHPLSPNCSLRTLGSKCENDGNELGMD